MLRAHTVSRRTIELRDEDPPALMPGHALVRVHQVALCGTDLHIWDDDYPTELPLVQGHEFTGRIEAIDQAAGPGLEVGNAVAVSPMVYCGTCGPCLGGRPNVCESISCLGCYEDGALAEVISVPVSKLHPVPEGMPLRLAVLGEPGSIAMQAVNRGRPEAGETALVFGCGPIGLLTTLFLTELGVNVFTSDLVPSKLEMSREFGAVGTLLAGSGPFPDAAQRKELESWCRMSGPTLLIEATGAPASFENALSLAAPTARIVQVGISTATAALSMRTVPFKELDILGSRNSVNLIPAALAALNRHQDLAEKLITHTFELAAIQEAFETMLDPAQGAGKIVISMPVREPASQPGVHAGSRTVN
ncbi:alcohol dehydrogenase catalytic domain-containing protein [Arthrobacter caoxuetaonis]|uniref:Alcohol dehydrogenase catalytic domain-containing protein n=1 Tax=Arthrobacter caoxuetaonis TaxID=2886935 RepID=A0A9X1MBC0_9MICC|nr:alcohol dehydrogenase catalytic domain-containing protein [Arthrobacter caoxuetaonis]MCC3281476.1 alcohol dehydrogenase catalytic domain-containing protein [Arthrobacter caoxuetaonis]MCC3296270.1 alcohol dehydrogenase catalytic domain-containing protein [Arthrobacter caoxuetaonis]USQ56881.1 alcohol dehydrogenase catalytic domain-containing protein [Arthrobacter caoxuetaonis]